MTNVNVRVDGGRLAVDAPFNRDFIARAKCLGGRWSAPRWVFDARDEGRVRALLSDVYGTDGSGPVDDVTLCVTFRAGACQDLGSLEIAGRDVARATGRDSGAHLGDGIVLISGGFSSGGSMKNWVTKVGRDGATVLIRDVPRALAERVIAAENSKVESICIEESEKPAQIDLPALAAERDRLALRISEIDTLLSAEQKRLRIVKSGEDNNV